MDGWRGSWRGWRRRGHAQLSINRLARLRAREVCESRGRGGCGMSSARSGSGLLDGSLLFGGAIVGGGRHARGAAMRPRRPRDQDRRRGLPRSRPRRRVVVLLRWLCVVVHRLSSIVCQCLKSALRNVWRQGLGASLMEASKMPLLVPAKNSFLPPVKSSLLSTTISCHVKPRSCDILDTPYSPLHQSLTNMSAHLTAVYTSPTATNTFSSPLESAPTQHTSSTEKSQYLGDLRQKVSQLQHDINQFLTEKMDQDKAATDAPNDDHIEEDMYGEEVVDEA
jgi:hypothetical protein